MRSLSLGAPELQIINFLNRIAQEMDQCEPGSSRAPNFAARSVQPNGLLAS